MEVRFLSQFVQHRNKRIKHRSFLQPDAGIPTRVGLGKQTESMGALPHFIREFKNRIPGNETARRGFRMEPESEGISKQLYG